MKTRCCHVSQFDELRRKALQSVALPAFSCYYSPNANKLELAEILFQSFANADGRFLAERFRFEQRLFIWIGDEGELNENARQLVFRLT